MSPIYEQLSPAWQACLDEAWQAAAAGSYPIGAVISGPDGEILARGHNHIRSHPGGPIDNNQLAHAELNALLGINKGSGLDVHACELYTTTEPCPLCLGAWYMSGVHVLRYASRDPYAGSANLVGATEYLSRKPVRVFGPQDPDLEVLLMGIHAAHVLGPPPRSPDVVLETWERVLPAGAVLGRRLNGSGLMPDLVRRGCASREAYAEIEEFAAAARLIGISTTGPISRGEPDPSPG